MSYPTFHDFNASSKSNITVSGPRADLSPSELHDLVGLLNTQPDVDTVAKTIAIHQHHRGKDVDVDAGWESLPEQTKDMWRGTAITLLTKFFIRAPFGS